MSKRKSFLLKASSILLLVLIWIVAERIIDAPLILPSPSSVFISLIDLLSQKKFFICVLFTLRRAFISFLISFLLGQLIGYLCGFFEGCKTFFSIPLSIIRVTPVVSVILMAMFIFSSNSVPVFVSVLMALPIMVTNVCSGFSKINQKDVEMAEIYKFSRMQKFRYIIFPAVEPFVLSGILSTWGLTWKVVVAGEVLCLPKNAIGSLLENSQIHLETSSVFALTIFLVIISYVLEKIFSIIANSYLRKKESR